MSWNWSFPKTQLGIEFISRSQKLRTKTISVWTIASFDTFQDFRLN